MKSTAQKLILISFGLSLVVAVSAFLYLKSINTKNEDTDKITVLVAAENIPPRTLIDKKMVTELQVPNSDMFGGYIKDSSKVIGKYTKETVYKNEGFNTNNLLDKDGNELSLKLSNNYRALSLRVTGDSGVSALIKPGDFVDIITYVAEKKDGAKVIRPDEAKIVLQNIELMAIDKELNREEKTAEKAGNKASDSIKDQNSFLVTLSVPTSEVEKLVLAESIGTIKLALRPLKDDNTAKSGWTTWEALSVTEDNKNTVSSNEENKPADSKSSSNYSSYTVKRGDTLKSISKKFYGDENKYTLIEEANNIKNKDLILVGEIIKIPELKK